MRDHSNHKAKDLQEILKSQGLKVKLNTINKGTMESLKVKDLRELARSRGLRGWSGLKKSDSYLLLETTKRKKEAHSEDQIEHKQKHFLSNAKNVSAMKKIFTDS